MVLLGRFVGFGVAVSGIADVAYLHEIAPPKFRGALVSCNEACISLGFLLAYIAAYFLTKQEIDENGEPFDEDINGWRYMFGIGGVFAVLQFIGMLFMPESPVWLKEKGHFEEALKVRNQIYGTSSNISSTSIDDDDEDHNMDQSQPDIWIQIPLYYRQAIIALFLAIAQQFCGNTNVLNYAPEIFSQAGMKKDSSLFATLLLGVLKFSMTIFVIFKVEQIGRRKLLIAGTSIISFSLFLIILAFFHVDAETGNVNSPILAIIGSMGVVTAYAGSFAPLTWLLTSELFPPNIRGRALGMSTIVTYICAMLVSYTFLKGQSFFGARYAPYILYLVISVASLLFVLIAIPDTGGKSVDEVEAN